MTEESWIRRSQQVSDVVDTPSYRIDRWRHVVAVVAVVAPANKKQVPLRKEDEGRRSSSEWYMSCW